MWVLTKVGVLGDGGGLVLSFLGGEPNPEPGLSTGYLDEVVSSTGGAFLSSESKLVR